MANKSIIGQVVTYTGDDHPYLKGYKVRIVAVMKPATADSDGPYINDQDELDREYGGKITAADRLEVQPYLEKQGRFSFVTSDPVATDFPELLS